MIAAVLTASCLYRANGALPDARCTPGVYNPAVTQSTIHQTICVKGWTATIRPPLTVTEPQKFKSMRAYGDSTVAGQAGLYEFDHLVPLELGGAPDDLRNLWPEPHHVTANGTDQGSYAKDRVENHLNALVCSAKMTLAHARRIMRTDWRTAP